jgi:PEGA domain
VTRPRLASLLLACALLARTAPARADDARARQYFKQGVELYDKKQYQPALEQFQKAYGEKASPGIKQNIALCLKGLGRPVEAATAFDEALDEGQGTLKPEVRAAMEHELEGLAKLVATVRLTVVSSADRKPVEAAAVTVDGAPLSAAQLRRPIRLEPGIHVFDAHAPPLADPPQKKLSLLAGSPVDATFEMGPPPPAPPGTLTVKPNILDAAVEVDGAAVASTAWPLRLPAGKHHVVVSAPGYTTVTAEIIVSPDAGIEYPITLTKPGTVLPYDPGERKAAPLKKRYLVPSIAYAGQSLRVAPILGERSGGSKRNFNGASLGVRAGYRLGKNFALELFGEFGKADASYVIDSAKTETSTNVLHWQLTPGVRFSTPGGIRFVGGMGVGVHGQLVDADVVTLDGATTNARTVKGIGVSASWLGDLGIQVDVGSLFLEALGFLDVHGVGTTRDKVTDQRIFLSSPSTRGGIRIGVGIPF